jgi:subfamily B ATP-binding cassette protein MsbA
MFFRDPVLIIIFFSSLFFISPQLTLLIIILLPISGFIIGRIGKSLKKTSTQARRHMGILLSFIEETLGGLRIIKAFSAESKIEERFIRENQTYTRIVNRVFRRDYLASPLSEMLGVFTLIIVMYYGATIVLGPESKMAPEVFIGYIAIFSQIINPAKSLTTAYYRVQKGLAAIERINEILDTDVKIVNRKNPISIHDFQDEIRYENVSFQYTNIAVLKNINLSIKKGKTIALVGQSGSGKSTLVDLLPRFYDTTSGQICIDGKPIQDLKLEDLRSLMGNVNQEPILFNDTIYNNIAFGENEVNEEEVIAAAKVANAHEFILETSNGYQTIIGDRGSKLSGGQRQRISIARAILKNPPILILDEATSALDSESESLVNDALAKLMRNRTSIVIAHRISTFKHADEIYVLDNGEIVEQGDHDSLLRLNGIYRKLHDLQQL